MRTRLEEHCQTGGLRATSDLRPFVTRPVEILANVLLVTFIFFIVKDFKNNHNSHLTATLQTATHVTDLKTYHKM
jgi:hypothetical protein